MLTQPTGNGSARDVQATHPLLLMNNHDRKVGDTTRMNRRSEKSTFTPDSDVAFLY